MTNGTKPDKDIFGIFSAKWLYQGAGNTTQEIPRLRSESVRLIISVHLRFLNKSLTDLKKK